MNRLIGEAYISLLPDEATDAFAKAFNDRMRQGMMAVTVEGDEHVISSGSDEALPAPEDEQGL